MKEYCLDVVVAPEWECLVANSTRLENFGKNGYGRTSHAYNNALYLGRVRLADGVRDLYVGERKVSEE